MKPFLAVALVVALAVSLYWGTASARDARLKALVSPEVFAALDAYRETHGRYPDSLDRVHDARLDAVRGEAGLHYLANRKGETFEFGFAQSGSTGSQWDIRSDRRSWSLDR